MGSPYDFAVDTEETDGFEPNEKWVNATSITVGEEVTGELPIGDADWFALDADAGESINLNATIGERQHRVHAQRSRRRLPRSQELGRGEPYFRYDRRSNRYLLYLVLRQRPRHRVRRHRRRRRKAAGPPNDHFERPNPPVGDDDRANATAVRTGSYENIGTVDDDRDVFEFRAARDARVVADVSDDGPATDLSLELTDAGRDSRPARSGSRGATRGSRRRVRRTRRSGRCSPGRPRAWRARRRPSLGGDRASGRRRTRGSPGRPSARTCTAHA